MQISTQIKNQYNKNNYISFQKVISTSQKVISTSFVKIFEIVIAKIVLENLANVVLSQASIKVRSRIFRSVIFAPIYEEFIFRGLFFSAIQYNYPKGILTEEEKMTQLEQKSFRIHFTAIIFALAHLHNPHPNTTSRVLQVSWSYIGGVIYGNLSEKYQSIAPGILAHGLNNMIALSGNIYSVEICLTALVINKSFFYILGSANLPKMTPKIFKNHFWAWYS